MVWPWGGHNDDVATVAMMERPLGPVKLQCDTAREENYENEIVQTIRCPKSP